MINIYEIFITISVSIIIMLTDYDVIGFWMHYHQNYTLTNCL